MNIQPHTQTLNVIFKTFSFRLAIVERNERQRDNKYSITINFMTILSFEVVLDEN